MKKQIALALAGTAAAVAGGFRLVQELVERSDRHESGADIHPEDQGHPAAPSAPSSTVPSPTKAGPNPSEAPDGASKAELYEIATTLEISGRSKMSKTELRDAIDAAS